MNDSNAVSAGRSAHSTFDWKELLSTHIGQTPRQAQADEDIACEALGGASFNGRLEIGKLGDSRLGRLVASPHRFRRALRAGSDASGNPLMLFLQQRGSCHIDHQGHVGILDPGDWCVLDTRLPFAVNHPSGCEQIILACGRPLDASLDDLVQRGIGMRFDGKAGMARVMLSTLREAFGQLAHVDLHSAHLMAQAVGAMTWDAMREQLNAPRATAVRDTRCKRIKDFIEAHLGQPDLSVETIAQGCGISTRSVHRAFADDAFGSVSNYIWQRRITGAARSLQDAAQADRSITEISMSWGFASSSHFSRAFQNALGTSPRLYRAGRSSTAAAATAPRLEVSSAETTIATA